MCGKWWSGALAEENAADIGGFTEHQPEAFGLVFDRLTEPQIQPAVVAALREKARVWVNTLWYGLAAGYTDETSLRYSARRACRAAGQGHSAWQLPPPPQRAHR